LTLGRSSARGYTEIEDIRFARADVRMRVRASFKTKVMTQFALLQEAAAFHSVSEKIILHLVASSKIDQYC
jgi:hypothetical protein